MKHAHEYSNYRTLIYSRAHHNANPYTDFDILVSEGNLAFVFAAQNFDSDNNIKFSTYLFRCADNAMKSLVTKEAKRSETEAWPEDFDTVEPSPEQGFIFKQWITALSKESQFIINVVWDTPADIVQWAGEENYCPKITIKLITRHLRRLGWKWAVIRSCYREIRKALKSF